MTLSPETLAAVMRLDYVRIAIELVDLVLRGMSIKDAAAEVGIHRNTAMKICRLAGVPAPPRRQRAPRGPVATRAYRPRTCPPFTLEHRARMSEAARRRYADPAEREKSRERARQIWAAKRECGDRRGDRRGD